MNLYSLHDRKTILVTPFFTIILLSTYGQKIDSLKSLLQEKQGVEKADVFFEMGREYIRMGQFLAATQVGREGYTIAEKFKDSLRIVRNGRVVASALRRSGAIDSAINLYRKLLPTSRKLEDISEFIFILNGLGIAYTNAAEYDKALSFFFQLLELDRHKGDSAGETITLNNIGLAYYKLRDYGKARTYFENSISLKKKINDSFDLGAAFVNLGLCDAYLGDFSRAQLNIKTGVEACGGACSDYVNVNADFAFGVVFHGLKQYQRAETYFLRSYKLSNKINDKRFQFDNIDYLTQIYLRQNRIKEALHYLNMAEALIDKQTPYDIEMIKIYSRLFQLYDKIEDHEKASIYRQKYIQLKDSTYNEELITNLMKVEADHLERENKAKLAAQQQILHLNEEIINRQKVLNVLAGCMVVMLALLAVVLIKKNSHKQIMNKMLDEVNKTLDERVQERTKHLNENHAALFSARMENSIQLEKTLQAMKSMLTSIKSFSTAGLHDITDPATKKYIGQVDAISDQLEWEVQRLQKYFQSLSHP